MGHNETYHHLLKEKQMSETPENTPVVDTPVIDTDAARSKTRRFLDRHRTKLIVAASTAAGVTCFVLGRKSKDVVESVDVDVNYADDNATQD
jgi:hypothetical protein